MKVMIEKSCSKLSQSKVVSSFQTKHKNKINKKKKKKLKTKLEREKSKEKLKDKKNDEKKDIEMNDKNQSPSEPPPEYESDLQDIDNVVDELLLLEERNKDIVSWKQKLK